MSRRRGGNIPAGWGSAPIRKQCADASAAAPFSEHELRTGVAHSCAAMGEDAAWRTGAIAIWTRDWAGSKSVFSHERILKPGGFETGASLGLGRCVLQRTNHYAKDAISRSWHHQRMKTFLGEGLGDDFRIGARGSDNLPILPGRGFARRRYTLSGWLWFGFLYRRGGRTFRACRERRARSGCVVERASSAGVTGDSCDAAGGLGLSF